jgi:hypothetical protein
MLLELAEVYTMPTEGFNRPLLPALRHELCDQESQRNIQRKW